MAKETESWWCERSAGEEVAGVRLISFHTRNQSELRRKVN